MNNTASIELLHALWVTIWDDIADYKDVLNSEQVHTAMTSINKIQRHFFWDKLKDALSTLVRIPAEIESAPFNAGDDHIPGISTRDWVKASAIDISPRLKKKFAPEQPSTYAEADRFRYVYDADDLHALAKLKKLFPGCTRSPFDWVEDGSTPLKPYTLPRIERFVLDADKPGFADKAIIDSNAENIFYVQGHKKLLMVSVRKKLNTWRMTHVEDSEVFRGSHVYIFT